MTPEQEIAIFGMRRKEAYDLRDRVRDKLAAAGQSDAAQDAWARCLEMLGKPRNFDTGRFHFLRKLDEGMTVDDALVDTIVFFAS